MRLNRLVITDLADVPVFDAENDDEGVCWEYPNGKPMIIAKEVGDAGWIWISSMASFRFPLKADSREVECVAVPHPGAKERSIIDGYYRMVLPMILQSYGLESMHGTAVAPPAGADGVGGPCAYTLHAFSTMGKTTLTQALAERGFAVLADDALILDPEGDGLKPARPALQPIPFAMRMREPTAELFGMPVRDKVPDPGDLGARDLLTPLPLAGCVLIERFDDGPVVLTRMAQHEAFKRLLDHCYTFDPFRKERTGQMMKAYLKLAREVPVVTFRYPSGLDRLAEVADRLADHLAMGFGTASGSIP